VFGGGKGSSGFLLLDLSKEEGGAAETRYVSCKPAGKPAEWGWQTLLVWIFEIADTSCRKELYFGRGRGEPGGRKRQTIFSDICAVGIWTRLWSGLVRGSVASKRQCTVRAVPQVGWYC